MRWFFLFFCSGVANLGYSGGEAFCWRPRWFLAQRVFIDVVPVALCATVQIGIY